MPQAEPDARISGMATLKQLKDMTKSKQWRDPYFRWRFGREADAFTKAKGISRQALADKLKLSEGTFRHAIHAGQKLSDAQARRLKGKPIRSFLAIEEARTEKEIRRVLDDLTSGNHDPTEARRLLRRRQRKVSTARLRGDPVLDLTGRANEFAIAARELVRLQLVEHSTTAKRSKLLEALENAKKAIVEAKKSANP